MKSELTQKSERERITLTGVLEMMSVRDMFFIAMCFLFSRVVFFDIYRPFGVALMASGMKMKKTVPAGIACLIGILSSGGQIYTLKYLFCIAVVIAYCFLNSENIRPKILAIVTGSACFVSSVAFNAFSGFDVYALLLSMIEAFISVFICIMFSEYDLFSETSYPLAKDFCLPLCFALSLAIGGLYTFLDFGSVSISEILWYITIMMMSLIHGFYGGVISGVTAGLCAALFSGDHLGIVGLYTVCGFACALASKKGIIPIAVSFLCAGVVAGAGTSIIVFDEMGLIEMVVSSVIFVFAAQKVPSNRRKTQEAAEVFAPDRANIVSTQLKTYSNTFLDISDTVKKLSGLPKKENILKKVAEDSVEGVCTSCSMRSHCWNKKANETYASVNEAAKVFTKKSSVDVLDFGEKFRAHCVRGGQMANALNYNYNIQKVNSIWKSQLMEARKILIRQYSDFSKLLSDSSDIKIHTDEASEAMSKRIVKKLRSKNVPAVSAFVFEGENCWPEIEIRTEYEPEGCQGALIEAVVSNAAGLPMRISRFDESGGIIRLEKKSRFVMRSGISTAAKSSDGICGDSYRIFNVKNNRQIIVMSDGMGHGEEASKRSRAVVDLTRKLIYSGFDKMSAAKLLSSALVLNNFDEVSATIDLAEIDLTLGSVNIIKAGAVKSYILRKDGIECLFSESLPVGIFAENDIAAMSSALSENDYCIMMSDGVKTDEGKLKDFVYSLYGEEPEALSRKLLSFAIEENSNAITDDITVIVSRLVSK